MSLKELLVLDSAIFGDAYGGSHRFAFELAQAMAKRGVSIHFLVANVTRNKPQSEIINGIHVHRYPPLIMGNPLMKGIQHIWQARKELKAVMKTISFDLVWGHSPIQTAAYLSLCRSPGKTGPPLIYTVHSPWLFERLSNKGKLSFFERTIIRSIEVHVIKRASLVHWLSVAMYEETKRAYHFAVPNDKALVLAGGTKRGHFPKQRPSLLSSRDSRITQFFVLRRLEPRMGLNNLIEACAKLAAKRHDFQVIIGGKGSLKDKLERAIREKGVSDFVKLVGFIPEEAVDSYYSRSHCVIIPSQELEGFGLVILEAWARGIPVIGTPVGGMKELLSRHIPECLTDGTDPESLARKMNWFMDLSLEEREALSRQARQAVEEYYWDNLVDRYLQVIEERF